MSYNIQSPELYSPRRNRSKRVPQIATFLIITLMIQMIFLYGLDTFFKSFNGIDLEPTTITRVEDRNLVLEPPLALPGLMTVSPDKSRLAVADEGQLRVYDLKTGTQILKYSLSDQTIGAMEWLPDRNRLIFAMIDVKLITQPIKPPVRQKKYNVFDETYSTDTYRPPEQQPQVTSERFQIAIYGLEGTKGASPELIQTLKQSGPAPKKVNISLSTYTNLLFLDWAQPERDFIVQIDIMNRIKDFRLPKGRLSKLVVSPRNGNLWVEMLEENSSAIYLYQKGRWRLQTDLDGYRLLGVTPDEHLAVALDQADLTREVELVDEKGNFKQGWGFKDPLKMANIKILKDGRLMYLDEDRVIVHSTKVGEGTLFDAQKVDCYSTDGKMVLSWRYDINKLNVFEEIEEQTQK